MTMPVPAARIIALSRLGQMRVLGEGDIGPEHATLSAVKSSKRAFRVTSYRKKLGHDITATKMTAQKASTTQFE
jgi:hypothetical protein